MIDYALKIIPKLLFSYLEVIFQLSLIKTQIGIISKKWSLTI